MEYSFVKSGIDTNSIQLYSELLSRVFPETDKFSKEYLKWQYIQNPLGTIVGYDAYFGETLAAHYATIPVNYEIEGEMVNGLLSLNTATHPEHRGKGLFTKLASKTYKEAVNLNYGFIIGVANQNSTHGFINKLGFNLISPLDVKIGIGEISYDKMDNYMIKPNWTQEALSWRFSNPNKVYYKHNNSVFSKSEKPWIDALIFKDYQAENTLKSCSPKIKMWIGLAHLSHAPFGFIKLPDFLRPSPLNLIFKDLKDTFPLFTKESFLFELVDFDAY